MVKQNRILAMVLLASIGITQIYALTPSRIVLPVATAAAVAGSFAAYNSMNNNGSEIINAPIAIENAAKVIAENTSHEDVQDAIISTKSLAKHAAQIVIEFVSKKRRDIIIGGAIGLVIGGVLVWMGVPEWLSDKFSNKRAHSNICTNTLDLEEVESLYCNSIKNNADKIEIINEEIKIIKESMHDLNCHISSQERNPEANKQYIQYEKDAVNDLKRQLKVKRAELNQLLPRLIYPVVIQE